MSCSRMDYTQKKMGAQKMIFKNGTPQTLSSLLLDIGSLQNEVKKLEIINNRIKKLKAPVRSKKVIPWITSCPSCGAGNPNANLK